MRLLAILTLIIYFIPSFISYNRKQNNKLGVFMFNLLFGWTILGRMIALVMAAWGKGDK